MLAEISITPLSGESHISDELAEMMRLIDHSNLSYELTPMGTCIEGHWDEVMAVICQCHNFMRSKYPNVSSVIRIEDKEGIENQLRHNVLSVEEKVGHPLRRDKTSPIH